MSTYKYNDKTQLTRHFNVSEFRCKCGKNHDTVIDGRLTDSLEKLFEALGCSKIIVNSGYRCPDHDRNVGGNGSGPHTKGIAADIVCYDGAGRKLDSRKVCCAAQDIGFGGIANIDGSYTAAHVDVRTENFWKGDEVKGTTFSVTSDFYTYYGLTVTDVYGRDEKEVTLVIDGVTYTGTLRKK